MWPGPSLSPGCSLLTAGFPEQRKPRAGEWVVVVKGQRGIFLPLSPSSWVPLNGFQLTYHQTTLSSGLRVPGRARVLGSYC